MLKLNTIPCGDSQMVMQEIDNNRVDSVVTDPPYGMSFMGKNWDKAVPSVAIWEECLRVLKPGAFALVMCIPRQDCLAHMIVNLGDAGFNIAFSSIYWTYASGFPKAQNLSKVADKRAGAKREVISESKRHGGGSSEIFPERGITPITAPATPQAKALDGAYGGFQPKPAVEIIIVAMKPLEEKTYVDQAMSNMHGCTWLDDCQIPYVSEGDKNHREKDVACRIKNDIPPTKSDINNGVGAFVNANNKGRFPANVLCEDNVLDDGIERKSGDVLPHQHKSEVYGRNSFNKSKTIKNNNITMGDNGSYSRFFSLDTWFAERIKQLPKEAQKTFPWLIVPKASKSEKNRGLLFNAIDNSDKCNGKFSNSKADKEKTNKHPTVKPIKLMSWLIILGTREGDLVLDPFCGSGTTAAAAKMLGRDSICIEREKESCEIACKRVSAIPTNLNTYNK